MPLDIDLRRYSRRLQNVRMPALKGRIQKIVGVTVEATGLSPRLGELCLVHRDDGEAPVPLITVGFRAETTYLMPIDELTGLGPGAFVVGTGSALKVPTSERLLGRVIDALGHPLDGGPPIDCHETVSINRDPPSPLSRPPIEDLLFTGVRALDGLLSVGKGQRLGIFAGSGVGKSTLLGSIARNALSDVNVIALIGERGREVGHFIETVLGPEGLARSILIVETSDAPPVRRYIGALTATALAEAFRDRGADVLFVMDSITRFASAQREIGLALGEPPTSKGYPPSVFALLPRLVERLGTAPNGSVTGLYTVLVDGDDMNDPIADAMRSLLDGHVVLSRDLANRGHFPPIDILSSVSRVMPLVCQNAHQEDAIRFRELYATYEQNRDLVEVGAYQPGSNPTLDQALSSLDPMIQFLRQQGHESSTPKDTLSALHQIRQTSTSAQGDGEERT